MKAYLINSKDELIVEVDVKDYHHKLELLNCRMLELYPYNLNGNDIWTDEEGNLKEYNYYVELDNKYIVSGNAIILSCDDEGDSADVKDLTIEELKSRVKFLGKRYIEQNGMGFNIREYQ
mgnify:FL=1